jgi:hypothetical protein
MTLTETLQIKERYLHFEDLRALEYCERRWQEEKRPTERWPLVNFIEKMLRELQRNGMDYPKVLLLRKKEIQRKEFSPAEEPKLEITPTDTCGGKIPAECIANANKAWRERRERF